MTETAAKIKSSPEYIGERPHRFRRFVSASVVQEHMRDVARRIRDDYRDKCPIIIGVLNGAFIFMADLVREMAIPCEVDFVKLSSYRDKMAPGQIQLVKDVDADLSGRHVIIVEDIIDTGRSEVFLRQHIMKKHPASVTMAAMFVKPQRGNGKPIAEYVGMEIPDAFVVGYGLDYAQQWRQLPDLYVLKPDEGHE